jgi:undecaprenyl-diphosphatase
MFEKIIGLDKELLVFLNGLGSPTYDFLWLKITNQLTWIPFFLLVFYLLYKKIGKQNFLLALLTIALIVLFSDQTCNLFKNGFQRLRPCNDETLKDIIRVVKSSPSYSFYSGHASNSMATTTFIFLIIRKYYKHAYLLFLFPLIFAYSRIYLGVHFPIDILTGYVFGILFGNLFYRLYLKLQPVLIKTKNPE